MISFKQFLEEAIKSKRAALRDLIKGSESGINPKSPEYRDQITTDKFIPNLPSERPISNTAWSMHQTHPDVDTRKVIAKHIQSIPLDKVVTGQSRVSKRVVAKKITGAFKREGEKESPRVPIFQKRNDGSYIVCDGNHRTMARKIRGFTHIRGIVDPGDGH